MPTMELWASLEFTFFITTGCNQGQNPQSSQKLSCADGAISKHCTKAAFLAILPFGKQFMHFLWIMYHVLKH